MGNSDRLGGWLGLCLAIGISVFTAPLTRADDPVLLRQGWQLRSSDGLKATGAEISSAEYTPQGWNPAVVPGTVVGSLVKAGVYPDPMFGMNMRLLPGTSYPIGKMFGHYEMPEDSPFRVPWWYRVSFKLPPSTAGKTIWLELDGISYRANVWLNGTKLAGAEDVAGTFRRFQLNATAVAKPGEENVLALEVLPPTRDTLSLTFVDWNPGPPDKSMGIWRDVAWVATGPVRLRSPQVVTEKLSAEGAELSVNALLRNGSTEKVQGTLQGMIDGVIKFEQDLELAPGEEKEARFDVAAFPQLKVARPRLWWPAGMGKQDLYVCSLRFVSNGKPSDVAGVTFGIRKVESEVVGQGKGSLLFKVNGQRVYIRGAAWTPDVFLGYLPNRIRAGISYAKDLGLNTIRLEGKVENDVFYDLADREGLLVLSGINCCDYWEHSAHFTAAEKKIARASVHDIIMRLRAHTSSLDWLNGSDEASSAEMEHEYIAALEEAHWPNPYQASASEKVSRPGDRSGLKMTGPYQYVAPNYWANTDRLGGAFGFNTETSPGQSIPPIESLKKFIPAEHLWPIDEVWDYHAAGWPYGKTGDFTGAIHHRFGPTRSLEEYAMKAQVLAYEGHRAMFEAYLENKYASSTGIIQWMLNSAWPSISWNLYDYYLRPGGAYFGAKSANEPLHVMYSLRDRAVVIANQTLNDYAGLEVSAEIYDLQMKKVHKASARVQVGPDSVFRLPPLPKRFGSGKVYFLRLMLRDSEGNELSRNFYWLSHRKEVPGPGLFDPFYLPTLQYADYQEIDSLPKIGLTVSSTVERDLAGQIVRKVTVTNPSASLAFAVRLKVDNGSGEEILPVLWQDNYFALLPGETRTVEARYNGIGDQESVEWSGWNVLPGLE